MSINMIETNYNAPEKTSNIKSVTSINDTTLSLSLSLSIYIYIYIIK
jgi:hypothetical protein